MLQEGFTPGDSHSTFGGRLRLITSVQALLKYFNLAGTKTRLSYDETVTRVQQCYAFYEEASLKSSRYQRLNLPDQRTRRDIICHHPELRGEDDPGRPLETKDKGDGAQPELHSTRTCRR